MSFSNSKVEHEKIEISETGFILYVSKYVECVTFYKDKIGLGVLYKKESLTCFEFSGSYLMVEKSSGGTENSGRDNTCIRMNVPDVNKACLTLDKHSITFNYNKFYWGEIAKFKDPAGNLIGFRSSKEHEMDNKQNNK